MRRILVLAAPFMVWTACAAPTPTTTPPTGAPPARTEVNLPPPPGVTIVAENLLQPRGLDFGPDGSLYIAEAGIAPPPGQNFVKTGRCVQDQAAIRVDPLTRPPNRFTLPST